MANINGTPGADTLIGEVGDDIVDALGGNDQVWAGPGDAGNDLFVGGDGDDEMGGAAGNDILIGDNHDGATDLGESGDDGANTLYGGAGNDLLITGGYVNDGTDASLAAAVTGGLNGFLTGTGNGMAWAGAGDDAVLGGGGNDVLGGGEGGDYVFGAGGNDVLYGGADAGADTLDGGDGDDTIFNGGGDDVVTGGAGNDVMWGGGDNDNITGGAGNDTFGFIVGNGNDTVADFTLGEDILKLDETGLFADAAAVLAAMADGPDGVVLTIDGSTSVTFTGLTKADFSGATAPWVNASGTPEGSPAGSSFVLTVNTDDLTGTSGDDTFTAPVIASGGVGGQPTLNVLDSIDGGAGEDVLKVETPTVLTGTIKNVENLAILGTGAVNGNSAVDASSFSSSIEFQQTTDTKIDVNNVTGQKIIADRVADGTNIDIDLAPGQSSAMLVSEGALGDVDFDVTGGSFKDATLYVDGTNPGDQVRVRDQNKAEILENVTIHSTGNSKVLVDSSSLKTAMVTGDGPLTLDFSGGSDPTVSIDSTGSTGGVSVVPTLLNGTDFMGGAGADMVTVGATTQAISMGGGNDMVAMTGSSFGLGGSADGGDGDGDILGMSSANAAAASANPLFDGSISNFEVLSLGATASGSNHVVDLDGLDGMSMVKSAGTADMVTITPAVKEVQQISINSGADSTGGLLTVGGVNIAIPDGMSAAAIENLIVAQEAAIIAENPLIESVTNGPGNSVRVTYVDTAGNVPNIIQFENLTPGSTVSGVSTPTPGLVGKAEVQTITVGNPALQTGSFNVGGVTVNVNVADTTNEVAQKIRDAINATASITQYASASVSGGNKVNVTYDQVEGGNNNVSTLSISGDDAIFGTGDGPNVTKVVDGTNGTAEVQTFTIGSAADSNGGMIRVGGVNIELPANATQDQIGTLIVGNQAAIKAANPNIETVGYNTTGNVVSITYKVNTGNVPSISVGENNNVWSGANPAVNQTTMGQLFNGTPEGQLTLNNMASGGTFELTGDNQGTTTINVTGAASGANDVMNLILNGPGALNNTGDLNIDAVETINITTTDSNPAADPTFPSWLKLNADDATSVTVSGNHGVFFDTSGDLSGLTSLDATGVTASGPAGDVTFYTQTTDKDVSLLGGAGDDFLDGGSTLGSNVVTIDGNGGDDSLIGGAGADILNGGDGEDRLTGGAGADNLTGGAGNDVFVFNTPSDSTLTVTDTITDFQANTYGNAPGGAAGSGAGAPSQWTGDVLQLNVGFAQEFGPGMIVDVLTNAADAQTFLQNSAVNGTANQVGAALDSSSNLLYLDLDSNGTVDSVIELAGVTDIDAAAFVLV